MLCWLPLAAKFTGFKTFRFTNIHRLNVFNFHLKDDDDDDTHLSARRTTHISQHRMSPLWIMLEQRTMRSRW